MKLLNFIRASFVVGFPLLHSALSGQTHYVETALDFAPQDINNSGLIVGYNGYVFNQNATAYSYMNGATVSLGEGAALKVNDNGIIAGSGNDTTLTIWNNGSRTNVADLGVSTLGGINNNGVVAVNTGVVPVFYNVFTNSRSNPTPYHAYDPSVPDASAVTGQITAINNANNYAGIFSYTTANGLYSFAFMSQLLSAGNIPGAYNTGYGHPAYSLTAMNDKGVAVFNQAIFGSYGLNRFDAFSTDGLSSTFLGADRFAWDINSSGTIVGGGAGPMGSGWGNAFVVENGNTYDLSDLIDQAAPARAGIFSAYGINDAGQIIGTDLNGQGILLTPIPEPSLYAASMGLLVLGVTAWRRVGRSLRI